MLDYFLIVVVFCCNPAHCGRGRRQISFPTQENATNADGCPPRLPCYLSTVGVCVEAGAEGKCPQGKNGRDPPVFERVDISKKELEDTGLKRLGAEVFRWKGDKSCPSCDRPSCQCLENFNSLAYLYPETYDSIKAPDPLPLCDQLSGTPWCFVHRHSQCCGDSVPSTEYPHVDVSYQACKHPQLLAQERCTKPCRCSPTFLGDEVGGQCSTTFQGDYWCFVDPQACCQMKVQSRQHTNLHWSTEPCFGSENQVALLDFESRVLKNGDLICDTDNDCFAVAGKKECTEDRAYCSQNSNFITDEFKDKFKNRGICLAEDHDSCTYKRDVCLNPCNTATCFSAKKVESSGFDVFDVSGATWPLSVSSLAGVSVLSLTGHLVTAGGCPSPTLPCRCGLGRNRCCKPMWGGRNKGLFCPRNYRL